MKYGKIFARIYSGNLFLLFDKIVPLPYTIYINYRCKYFSKLCIYKLVMTNSIYYALVYPIVNFADPYFNPIIPSLTSFMSSSYIPVEFIPTSHANIFYGWYVFQTSDPVNSQYKIGDIVPENTVFNQDYSYWVYPVWGEPIPPKPFYPDPVLLRNGPAYTNNSIIYYKSHSLPACGTAGVKNARIKSRRT